MFRTGELTVDIFLNLEQNTLQEHFANVISTTEVMARRVFEGSPQHPQQDSAHGYLEKARTFFQAQDYFSVNQECAKALLAVFGVSRERIDRCEQEAQQIAQQVLQVVGASDISSSDEESILKAVTQDVMVAYPRLMMEGDVYEIENFQFSAAVVVQMVSKYANQIVGALKK